MVYKTYPDTIERIWISKSLHLVKSTIDPIWTEVLIMHSNDMCEYFQTRVLFTKQAVKKSYDSLEELWIELL